MAASVLVVLYTCTVSASDGDLPPGTVYQNVGDVRLALPAPEGFTTDCNREPNLSRVIAAMGQGNLKILASYLTVSDCQAYLRGHSAEWFSPYLLVQVDRSVEDRELSSANFEELRRILRADQVSLWDQLRPELRSLLDSPNRALSDIAGTNAALSVGEVIPLGVFAESATRLSMGVLMKQRLTLGENIEEHLQLCTTSVVLVRSKLLFLYVYRSYGSDDDLQSIKRLTTQWIDQVLAAN